MRAQLFAAALVTATLAAPMPLIIAPNANAMPATCYTAQWAPIPCPDPATVGDRPDVQEDDPLWDCVDMGDRVCGPGNSNGVPAACYDDGGVIVALWPCYVVENPDGSSDVYTPDARVDFSRQFDDTVGSDPRDDVATGPNAYDGQAYVGGWN